MRLALSECGRVGLAAGHVAIMMAASTRAERTMSADRVRKGCLMRTDLRTEDLGDLLEQPLIAVLATRRKDDTVMLSPVWFEWHDGGINIWVPTPEGGKVAHVRRDPRVTVVVANRRHGRTRDSSCAARRPCRPTDFYDVLRAHGPALRRAGGCRADGRSIRAGRRDPGRARRHPGVGLRGRGLTVRRSSGQQPGIRQARGERRDRVIDALRRAAGRSRARSPRSARRRRGTSARAALTPMPRSAARPRRRRCRRRRPGGGAARGGRPRRPRSAGPAAVRSRAAISGRGDGDRPGAP